LAHLQTVLLERKTQATKELVKAMARKEMVKVIHPPGKIGWKVMIMKGLRRNAFLQK